MGDYDQEMWNKVLLMNGYPGFLVWLEGREGIGTCLQFTLWQSWWKIIGNLPLVSYISFEGVVNSHSQCCDNLRYWSNTSDKRLLFNDSPQWSDMRVSKDWDKRTLLAGEVFCASWKIAFVAYSHNLLLKMLF